MMNRFNMEITYKDICNLTYTHDSFSTELIVELHDGSTIKASRCNKPSDLRSAMSIYNNEKYDALDKVVNDYLRYIEVLNNGQDWIGKTLKEVEEELEAEYDEYEEECEDVLYGEEYEIEEDLE